MGTLFHPSKRSEITGLIRSRLAQSGRDTGGVEIMNYTYEAVHGIEDDEYMLSMWRRMLILSLGLSLFSGLIIQSAYRNHIAAFSPELMELASWVPPRDRLSECSWRSWPSCSRWPPDAR